MSKYISCKVCGKTNATYHKCCSLYLCDDCGSLTYLHSHYSQDMKPQRRLKDD